MKAIITYPANIRANYPEQKFTIEVPDEEKNPLEWVFREMNVVDGNEMPIKLKCRSMMMGDTVEINGEVHLCESVGWKKLPSTREEEENDYWDNREMSDMFAELLQAEEEERVTEKNRRDAIEDEYMAALDRKYGCRGTN